MVQSDVNIIDSQRVSGQPCVSIGLPVYNGADFLEETIDSILAQTFGDFELVISDNASTDTTKQICKSYASLDNRVRYFRNEQNLGAAKNYNRLVELARGNYFKWAAADDLIAPGYLARCVEVLDSNPDVLVCQTAARMIDEEGNDMQNFDDYLDLLLAEPHVRLRNHLSRGSGWWNEIFGLIRLEELRKTPLIGSYIASDYVLLGELVLRGKIHHIPERLFLRRRHPGQAGGAYNKAGPEWRAAVAVWFDPANKHKFILNRFVQHFFAYLGCLRRVPLSWREKLLAYAYVTRWAFHWLVWLRLLRLAKKLREAQRIAPNGP